MSIIKYVKIKRNYKSFDVKIIGTPKKKEENGGKSDNVEKS